MKKFLWALSLAILAAQSASAQVDPRVQAIADGIKDVDDRALIYVVFISDCTDVMGVDDAASLRLHRDFAIAALQEAYLSRDRALLRFDEQREWAMSRIEPIGDLGFCRRSLDELRHQLDVAVARYNQL